MGWGMLDCNAHSSTDRRMRHCHGSSSHPAWHHGLKGDGVRTAAHCAYSATKLGGVVGLMRSFALSLATDCVRVTPCNPTVLRCRQS